MKLIIVESPTKARTITTFLGKDFLITSSNGHIRDLPKGKLGVDIENNFEPSYVIPTKKRKIVNQLKKLAKKAKIVYLATDEDREGEAISWHLSKILESKNFQRISFHEITKEAIKNALKNPRDINTNLVKAQKARRILDRLVGYKLSPILWKKIAKHLSAGRVQSPTLRLIVEREKDIQKFKPQEYWSIIAKFTKHLSKNNTTKKENEFEARLYKIDNKIIDKLAIKSKDEANKILEELDNATYKIINVKKREIKKYPLPPFKTSTLQQEANRKLHFPAKQTMFLAQKLYEGIELEKSTSVGLITYMRTDSLNLSEKFLSEANKFIKNNYGNEYSEIRRYKTKTKSAQEAHEAIRPTLISQTPDKIKKYLDKNLYKLYNLIWQRAVASQMTNAIFSSSTIDINAKQYLFRATGGNYKFDGWLKLYPDKQKINNLPDLKIDEKLNLEKLNILQHFTEPPAHYNDASLVKALEKYGIGRPSTYAPIISTIQARNYVQKEKGYFKPTEIGILVNDLLVKHFPKIVDYHFTAKMENDLDEIANGRKLWLKMIKNFYSQFIKNLQKEEKKITKSFTQQKTDKICPLCGKPLVIKMGRFGKFLACTGFPKCKYTKSLKEPEKIGIKCPKCHKGEVVIRRTKKGRIFYGCSRWPKCDFASWKKPNEE